LTRKTQSRNKCWVQFRLSFLSVGHDGLQKKMSSLEMNYTYAVGKIRVLESRLLSRAKFERILEVRDGVAALQELTTTAYVEEIFGVKDEKGFEDFRQRQFLASNRLVIDLLKGSSLGRALLTRFDCYNLATLLKASYGGIDAQPYLVDLGNFSLDALETMVKEKNFKELSPLVRDKISYAIQQYESKPRNFPVFDFVFDQVQFQILCEAMQEESGFLKGFFERMIDLINLRSFLRAKEIFSKEDFLKFIFLSGGRVETKFFTQAFEISAEEFQKEISSFGYGKIFGKAGIDKNIDDYLTEYLKPAKSIVFTKEPLIGWLWAKEIELKNLGLLIRGKFNRVPADWIRAELRETYV